MPPVYLSSVRRYKLAEKAIVLQRNKFTRVLNGLDHALVVCDLTHILDHALVACGLTQILAEGSGCRWVGGGGELVPDHDSWWGPVV